MSNEEYKATAEYFKAEDGYINYVDFIHATSDDLQSSLRPSTQQMASQNVLGSNAGQDGNPMLFESVEVAGNNSALRRTANADDIHTATNENPLPAVNHTYMSDL